MIRKKFLAALVFLLFSLMPLQEHAEAAEFRSGIEVLIARDEAISGDLYIVAGRVVVDGIINGDLVAAGESIEVNGSINGDLIAAGRIIIINGIVEDDVRAAGADLQLRSSVGGDLVIAGGRVIMEAESVIGEDAVVRANTLISRGEVNGDFELRADEATIAGSVKGSVVASIQDGFTLGPNSSIDGELSYTSLNDVAMQSGALIAGDITRQVPTTDIFGVEYAVSTFIQLVENVIAQAKWFLGTLLVGLVLLWLLPETMRGVIATLANSPWRSLGVGVLMLPLLPIAMLLVMIVVLSIIGSSALPAIAVPAMLYTGLLLLSKPLIAVSIGGLINNHVIKRRYYSSRSALAIGAAVLACAGLIPFVDSIVGWLTLLLGFGMWVLFFYRHYRTARSEQTI